MRHSLFTAGLAALVGFGTMGCQSAPRLAWWKNSNKSDVQTNAVAHSAPELPSEIARQTEGLAANASAENTIASTAPPFESAPAFDASKSSDASPYPSTGAPDYSGSLAQTSSAPAATASTSSTMPYNPSAVPPPSHTASTPTPSVASVDRYGTPSSASSAPAFDGGMGGVASMSEAAPPFASTQAASTPSSNPGMASAPGAPQESAILSSSSPSTGFGAAGVTGGTDAQPYSAGDRYASTQSTPATTQSSSPSTSSGASDGSGQSASLATSEPYRPGGTSTYPSTGATQPSYEIATRPDAPASTSGGSTQQVPNVATPDSSGFQYR